MRNTVKNWEAEQREREKERAKILNITILRMYKLQPAK